MTRDEKIAEAKRLKGEGLNLREIGERLGHGPSVIWKWLNPAAAREKARRDNAKRGPKKRQWERENRAECPQCSKPLKAGSRSPSKRPALCRECDDRRRRELVHERAERIEKWWADGESMTQIAERLGWSREHLGQEMHTLRGKGYTLPYRRPVSFPEQVPSA